MRKNNKWRTVTLALLMATVLSYGSVMSAAAADGSAARTNTLGAGLASIRVTQKTYKVSTTGPVDPDSSSTETTSEETSSEESSEVIGKHGDDLRRKETSSEETTSEETTSEETSSEGPEIDVNLPKADIEVPDGEGPDIDVKLPKLDIEEIEKDIEKIEEALEDEENGGHDTVEILPKPDKVTIVIEESDHEEEVDLPPEEWERFVRYEKKNHPDEVDTIEEEIISNAPMSEDESKVFLEQVEEFLIEEESIPMAQAETETETVPISSAPKTGAAGVTGLAGAVACLSTVIGLKKRRK